MEFNLKALLVVCMLIKQSELDTPEIFYPFGTAAGDELLFYNDDSFLGPINIALGFPFFEQTFYSLFVNTNGGVSFERGVSSYTPNPFPIANDVYFIAGFWADVDTTPNKGSIYYRETTDTEQLNRITADVLKVYSSRGLHFFTASWAYIVTWENVTHYGGSISSPVNSFQLILLTDGTYSFTIFNFGQINWTIGTASGGVDAQVGFNAGDGINYFVVPGSRTPDIADVEETTNVGVKGRWIFRVDQAKIDAGKCFSSDQCAFNEEDTENGCQVIAPALNDCPQLVGPTVVDGHYVYFYCDLIHDFTDTSVASFQVTFLFNDEHDDTVPTMTTSGKRVSLHEKYLLDNLGKWISCSVVSYFNQSPGKKSAPYVSNSYFAGVTPSTYDVRVNEGDELPSLVQLKSTLPVTCLSTGDQECHTAFSIVSSGDLMVYQKTRAGSEASTCQYRLEEGEWKNDESLAYSEDNQLEILTVKGPLLKPPKVATIVFERNNFVTKKDMYGSEYVDFWTGYKPPPVTVYRYDGIGATCAASGDPRMTTFDGVNYPVYAKGQFVLVSSQSLRNFEVHVRHKNCDRSVVACVCAVAVREGNDTLSLDMCKSALKPRKRTASEGGKLADGARIISNGANAYTIRVPSGAYITVYVFDWGMNVYLKVLSQDMHKTKGLCGTFDNNPENDFMLQRSGELIDKDNPEALENFIESWRVLAGDSLFEKDPVPQARRNAQKSCRCAQGKQVCGSETDEDQYKAILLGKKTIIQSYTIPKQTISGRKKRNTMLESETDYVDFEYNPVDFDYAINSSNNLHFIWPTDTGITETQAWQHCNTTLVESVVYQACSNYSINLHLDDVILKCVEDIKVTGSYDWANDKISELQGNCIDALLESNSTTEGNATSDAASETILNIVGEVVANICPSQCNSKGDCLNSTCVCIEGYEGVDCSVDSSLLPYITSLGNGGICNFHQTPCQTVYIMAENIIDTETLLCQIKIIETGEVFYTNGTYQGLKALICPLPPLNPEHNLLTYQLSMTKNGSHYGNSKEMKVFDGNCIECYNIQQCSVLNSHCSINGKCFESSEGHPSNACYICDPAESKATWSISPENGQPEFGSASSYAKLRNEEVVVTLKAGDPENETIIFLLDKTFSIFVTLLQNGTLIWRESSNENMTIPVVAQDVCGQNHTEFIELSIIECPCPGNGVCVLGKSDGSGVYDCTCPPGFTDELCQTNIDDCLNVSCNKGTCIDGINMYTCSCEEGYTGEHRETEITECESSPCQFGTCQDEIAEYTCVCYEGYTGFNCETDINECSSGPCQNGNCSDAVSHYTCECLGGFTGLHCEMEIDECQSSPCVNGTCNNEVDKYNCQCFEGFSGINCDENIDECASSPCKHGECVDFINQYSCLCIVGFTGERCESNIDDCSSDPCVNGECLDRVNHYECNCSGGFSGYVCDVEINECSSSPCKNGYCIDLIDKFNCTCDPGYEGVQCEINTDECASNPCVNGICEDVINGYECNCSQIFLGKHCEIDTRFAIWGEWSEYTPCTKSCDYGLQKRQRQCLLPGTCSGIGEETELCNTNNCPEIENEMNIGITAVISGVNMEQFLQNVKEMLTILADGINQHCYDDPNSCCSLVSSSAASFDFENFDIFQSENLRIGSGFPKELENGDIIILIIGEINEQSLTEACFNRSDGGNGTVSIVADIIEDAIVISADSIQSKFEFTITIKESTGDDSSTTAHIIYITVGVLCTVLLLSLGIFLAIFLTKRKRKMRTFDVITADSAVEQINN